MVYLVGLVTDHFLQRRHFLGALYTHADLQAWSRVIPYLPTHCYLSLYGDRHSQHESHIQAVIPRSHDSFPKCNFKDLPGAL